MAASLNPLHEETGDRDTKSSGHASLRHGRVMSVSPHAVEQDGVAPELELESSATPVPLVAETPAAIRALIDQALNLAAALANSIGQAAQAESKAAKSALHLQERLRLSARMLKAFQSQIGRVENAITLLQTHEDKVHQAGQMIEQHAAELPTRCDSAVVHFEERLQSCTETALVKFEERLSERTQVLAEVEQRIAVSQAQLESVEQRLAQATSQCTDAATLADHTIANLETALANVNQAISRSEDVQNDLAAQSQQAKSDVEQGLERCIQAQAALDQCSQAAAQTHQQLDEQLVRAASTIETATNTAQMVDALQGLLAHLSRWEPLLLQSRRDAEGLPEPLANLAQELRGRIDQNTAWLSSTLRTVAERVDELARLRDPSDAPPLTDAELDDLAASPPAETLQEAEVKPPLRFKTWAGRA